MAKPDILILRPQPGATQTAERAKTLGLLPVIAPIFHVVPMPWEAPAADAFDGIVFTSAFAVRESRAALGKYLHLACYAVGESSAEAARRAGFRHVRTGPSDAKALSGLMMAEGVSRALHLCGQEHVPFDGPVAERRIVCSSDPLPFLLPEAVEALSDGALPLLHSPRAARHFAALIDGTVVDKAATCLVAISKAAATAAGPGWRDVFVAASPRDLPLLELAASLCHKPSSG